MLTITIHLNNSTKTLGGGAPPRKKIQNKPKVLIEVVVWEGVMWGDY